MLAFVEIGLTVWAWKRGWKGWALLPFSLVIVAFILGLTEVITLTNWWMAIFGDLAIVGILSWMVAKPRHQNQLTYTGEISLPNIPIVNEPVKVPVVSMAREQFNRSMNTPVVPAVKEQHIKPVVIESFTAIQPPTVVYSSLKATLVLPDNSEISLNDPVRPVGRGDFDKVVSLDALRHISRNHFLVRSDNGKYYMEDLNSMNGTKTNGIEIRGRRCELNNGDKIEVAGVAALTFKVA